MCIVMPWPRLESRACGSSPSPGRDMIGLLISAMIGSAIADARAVWWSWPSWLTGGGMFAVKARVPLAAAGVGLSPSRWAYGWQPRPRPQRHATELGGNPNTLWSHKIIAGGSPRGVDMQAVVLVVMNDDLAQVDSTPYQNHAAQGPKVNRLTKAPYFIRNGTR